MSEPTAQDLLGDLRSLRDRARADRHGYAFPLFLFAGLILLAPLVYVTAEPVYDEYGGYQHDGGPFPRFVPMFAQPVEYPGLIGWYWVLTIVLGLAATGWWYRQRAARLGVETDTRLPYVAAGAAFAGLLLWQPVLDTFARNVGRGIPLYSAPWLNLPLLFASALLTTAVLTWTFRPQRTDGQRRAGVFAGVLFASLTFACVGVYLLKGFSALLVIAAALLVLAWRERSVLLAVVAATFTVATIPANHWLWDWDVSDVYERLGWGAGFGDVRIYAVQNLLLPGLVLLAGGAVAALTRHGASRG